MQPTLCSRCKKNVAVVFISRLNEKNEQVNEGLCLKCAAQLGLPQVDEMMKRMGITPEDLDNISNEMMQAFGGAEELPETDDGDEDDEESGKTATFPFLNRLFGNNGNPPAQPQQPSGEGNAAPNNGGRKTEKKRKFLDNYCINLSQRARQGKLDAVIGREQEIERVVQILNRRQKNNPCLIGEPGVGKTAIAEGLAQRIAAGEVPFKLRDKEVYLLDLTALVAGTQFRGQFESRMKGLIEEIRKAGNIILVIDEVHNIVGAGDAEGSMNAANILKPALSRGEIQVIGATTFNEYRKHIEKDTALERRFQPVTVNEPNIEDTLKILRGIAHYYEQFHGVSIPDGVLRQAVSLSERYITDRYLPDKAIDLIDEACSDMNLHDADINRRMELEKQLATIATELETLSSEAPEEEQTPEQMDQRYARIAQLRSEQIRFQQELETIKAKGTPTLTMDNIARVIEMWTKIPASKIKEEEFQRLSQLETRLKKHIVGQDEAVAAVAATLGRFAMDVCLYMSQNFGFVSFPDELTTGSSIMPHKKNPDVFEIMRGRCNRLQSVPNEIALLVTNLPLGYHRDLQLLKDILFPATATLAECLAMCDFMLQHIRVRENILDDARYDYLFTVEDVNRLVLQGVPFREAYRRVGEQVQAGTYRPTREVRHTHEGSIGNLCNDRIRAKMERVMERFE